jgi:RNA polymerase sigma-70 factor (ECF subfamily)
MQLRSKQDEWLMRQTAQGNRDALEVLVRRYASPLLTFIRRMVGDEHRSEELFQEVFLSVWRNRHQYDEEKPFRPWLYQIALNRCRQDFRKKVVPTADVSPDTVLCSGRHSAPMETAIAVETSARVAAAVQLLPEAQRIVVALRVWQNLPYSEIASILNCSQVTARSHMHIALLKLKKHLSEYVAD